MSGSPYHTPKSNDKSSRDSRSSESGGSCGGGKNDRDRGVNIQVILRCRPLNGDETKAHTPVAIFCNDNKREVSAVQSLAHKQIDRTFVFDKVFGPASEQSDLFDRVVSPIVNEVLEGYNCTIFAYGQTGTGKTYTMEGGRLSKDGRFPDDAGVIPRALRRVFEILDAQNAEYTMKVSFLELYNEELTDLLAPPDQESRHSDDRPKKPIALMEDGKGGVLVRGLEEETVTSAGQIYRILEKGSSKRRTAETLLNKQSSRSHTIFSVTILLKECTPDGAEMFRCGKLNLVDLAGSENILRSGARDERAREAGEINKSLLTLGRVINTLVEHAPHIPYRDSKLTRLLRDSLGGKTKTCIIATISPSIHCLEETLSTLDYAHRAKNIKNRPEVNQKVTKGALIKDLYSEIDRLKQEVYAAREKNGVYVPKERYLQDEADKKAMAERTEIMELELELKDKQLAELEDLHNSQKVLNVELSDNLEKTQRKLGGTEHALCDLEERHRQANITIKEKEYLISNLLRSEKALTERAHELRYELENAAADVSGLFLKIERKDRIEDENKTLVKRFQAQLSEQLEVLHRIVSASATQQANQLTEMEKGMQSFVANKTEATEAISGRVRSLKDMYAAGIRALGDLADELNESSQSTFDKLNAQIVMNSSTIEECFKGIELQAGQLLDELQTSLSKQENKLASFALQQLEQHLRSVETARSISKITTNFFHTLDVHASKLSKIVEESQTVQYQQLRHLEKNFEESAAKEERQLLEKVAEMLASSNARQRKLVQTAVDSLRKNADERTSCVQTEMSTAHDFTSSVRKQWTLYMEDTETHYLEDTATVKTERCSLEEGLQQCMVKLGRSSQQWRAAQESLIGLEEDNVASIDSIAKSGVEANEVLRARLSSAASTSLQDYEVANKDLLSSIDCCSKLDHGAKSEIDSIIVPCREELRELRSRHYHNVMEITENAEMCLEEEYVVDEPTCSTPGRRSIALPNAASIEELRAPALEDLLRSFREARPAGSKQANGEAKQFSAALESPMQPPRDSRVPLIALN
ncbi:putative 125 kDa kinesin-related protein [Iris pallida]|uniref:125 kDa kinesin-related protein n=1 Tax=Iris pallida TaxID=29817 RepID=A0AAX6ELW0_IRIPA|nr:putative 125 kDa kinesin-related protein [Iris pallida]